MAATTSTMMPLGTAAPDFGVSDVRSGEDVTLETFAGRRALLVMFICRHCPFVQHVKEELARLGWDYLPRDVGIVAISSNDATTYPDDSPEGLRELAEQTGFTFSLCFDESQDAARAYGAACTPDFFLFDGERRLVYRGQLDGSRPGNGLPVDGRDLRAALDALLAGQPVSEQQRPSVGCSIKWRAA